jgi:hypothetical protein
VSVVTCAVSAGPAAMGCENGRDEGEGMSDDRSAWSRRGRWRLAAAVPLPLLLGLYALWTELVTLDGAGLHLAWDPGDLAEWGVMALGTVLLVAGFWSASRSVRVLACAVYSLVLAFGFGAAGVIAIVHAFGGPRGDLEAPGWALGALTLTSALCALALLALGALLVDDIRAADAAEG